MAKKKIQIDDKWYVLATFAHPEEQPQVLKNDETFAMFDRFGDVAALAPGQEGLYHNDTRYLSHQELTINGARPLYLGSSVEEANSLLVIDLMNPDLTVDNKVVLPKGTLHLYRAKLLWKGACYEHLRLSHHGEESATVRLEMTFDGDFIDLFEVRGMQRKQRGERSPPEVAATEVVLPYQGRDGRARRTRVRFEPAPRSIDAGRASWDLRLDPGEEHHLYCTVVCECEGEPVPAVLPYHSALHENNRVRLQGQGTRCAIETSNPLVNLWLDRSVSDLAMLTTELPSGPYPFAGVPWYSTTFGRDGILTALEYLWVDPNLARGVLCFLAATQATESDAERDAEPGKILHEARASEMAHTREIPFGRYYGTVDATPLFLVLAAAYWQRTADEGLIRSLWPHLLAALRWIDESGDVDGDGFVEYARRSAEGLVQQGWKDSNDSVFHRDGQMADAPIALCEVQGYVYQGKRMVAEMARHLGETALADRLAAQAEELRRRFQSAFWCDDLATYALALDGQKKPCQVLSSNTGHCLWSGIAAPEHAQRVIDGLMGADFFSGWGIRTIAAGQPRYNPMSYHNGSVWPHDNALAAAGMAGYGRTEDAVRLFSSLFDASLHFDLHRLPELFCGFPRRAGAGPTLYPVACSPQAWAAAAPFAILQACLGLEVRADTGEMVLKTPRLPPFIDWLRITRLGAPGPSCDLLLQRYERNVGVEVLRKDPALRVSIQA
ncbi:amylo-alpha-1,6-glucosidase [Caenimonas sedimenti]|uniref:Amylo-alpha-1,6-glucosidase n=1 Tax=Caenimonas sedimenti TaxID=2596921 RepID=A0A562ZTC8_9BURK|nr:glycogen debranching N-terminal domain-containing protein [Caenimonas sedimenti]TWO71616.1 amylo-alpha-1,6-glucosidase [Caenimonas sedimenti]